MPSVMQTTRSTPASAASRIASAANRAGTKMSDVLAPGLLDRLGDRVEHRDARPPPGRPCPASRPATTLRAVGAVPQRVERPLRAGDPLATTTLRPLVDQDRHATPPPRARARRPPRRGLEHRRGGHDPRVVRGSARIAPALLGVRAVQPHDDRHARRRRGSSASSMPLATRSQRVIPPKMLTSTIFTAGSDRTTSSEVAMLVGAGAAADVEEVRRAARPPGARRRASTSPARRRCR